MILRAKRPPRSIDYVLATLSPLDVACAVRRHLGSQPAETLRSMAAHVLPRLDEDERALFDSFDHSHGAPDRFVEFVARNPRVLGAFDGPAAREILLAAISEHEAIVDGTEIEEDLFDVDTIRASLRAALPPVSLSEAASKTASAMRRGLIEPIVAIVMAVAMLPVHGARALRRALRSARDGLIGLAQLALLSSVAALRAAWRAYVSLQRLFGSAIASSARALACAVAAIWNGLSYVTREVIRGTGAVCAAAVIAGARLSGGIYRAAIRTRNDFAAGSIFAAATSPFATAFFALCAAAALIIILLPYLGNMSYIRAPHDTIAMHRGSPVATPVGTMRSAARASYARIAANLRQRIDHKLHKLHARENVGPRDVAAVPKPHRHVKPVRVASVPKPHHYRAVWRTALHRHPRAIAAIDIPPNEPPLVQRARLVVSSYLQALMENKPNAALGNLGLKPNAPYENLTEAKVLARARAFRIVAATLKRGGNAKIDVEIHGENGGEYFGYYLVTANGPAVWISEHEVIPITHD
jgi:hypothetical protein